MIWSVGGQIAEPLGDAEEVFAADVGGRGWSAAERRCGGGGR